jgi:hypothetical protein
MSTSGRRHAASTDVTAFARRAGCFTFALAGNLQRVTLRSEREQNLFTA